MAYLGNGKITIKTDTVLSIDDIEIEIMSQEESWNDNAQIELSAGDVYIYNAQNIKPQWEFSTKWLSFEEYQKIIAYIMSRLNRFETIEIDQIGGEIEAKFINIKSSRGIDKNSNIKQRLSFGIVKK